MTSLAGAPVRSVMPSDEHLCYRDCAHIQCNAVRHQRALPCDVCHNPIAPRAYLYVLERNGAQIIRQVHAACYEARR